MLSLAKTIEEAVLDHRELKKNTLIEIQWVLFQCFGYDTYEHKWFQNLCEKWIGHTVKQEWNTTYEDVGYYCDVCGKQRL